MEKEERNGEKSLAKAGGFGRDGLVELDPVRKNESRQIPESVKLDPDAKAVVWWEDEVAAFQNRAIAAAAA